MFTALDQHGNTILSKDAVKGTDYICPFCGEKIRFRKGNVYRPHFAHMSDSNCPFDKDSKSEWHMHMQELFPLETLEKRFVDERTGEIHIADVFLEESNTVIEFQKSRISDEEFVSRTLFHTSHGRRIVWVFYERNDAHPETEFGRFKQEYDESFSYWHKNLHYHWSRCPRKALRAIKSLNPKVDVLQMPNYSICVNYDDSDVVHRLIHQTNDYEDIWMSVHNINITSEMDINEFFISEVEWLHDELEKLTRMAQQMNLQNQPQQQIHKTATWTPPRYPKRVRRGFRF